MRPQAVTAGQGCWVPLGSAFGQKQTPETDMGLFPLLFGVPLHENMRPPTKVPGAPP